MMKTKFKRIAITFAMLLSIGLFNVNAQESNGLFNHLSIGIGVGSYGADFEAAAPIGNMFAIRGGVGFLPDFSVSTDVNAEIYSNGTAKSYDVDIKGKLQRIQGKVILNFYPLKKSGLFIAAGAYFGGDKLLEIEGHSDQVKQDLQTASSAGIIIGDKEIPFDKNGNVAGGLKVQQFRPYIGIGFGRVIPNKRINFMFEAGVQFHGTPEIYTDNGTLSASDIDNSDDKFTKIVDKLKVYPVINFKLNTRIF